MPGLTRFSRQAILNHIMGINDLIPAANLYIGLFTTAPTADTPGVEVLGIDYARVNHNDWLPATASEPSVIANDGNIIFPEAGGAWGLVEAFGIFDDALGGNLIAYGLCSQDVGLGTVVRFLDTQLTITLDEV